jgi:hypothetical protein
VEYFVFTMTDGSLANATFGWSKNEIVNRFGYDGRNQRFKLLVGSAPTLVGTVGPTLNTSRVKVTPPVQVLAAAPFRLSVGAGSGTDLTVVLVTSFGSPVVGTVELLQTTGELNWNASDLVTYVGQDIRWQRQQFFTDAESKGNLGKIEDILLLTPLPGTGQQPLLRIGYGLWLLTIEVANDAALAPDPAVGSVKWSAETGRLRFNASDITANLGRSVYYDGVLFARDVQLPRQFIGTVAAPTAIVGLPPTGGDLIFRVPGHQFPAYVRLDASASFTSPGDLGVVQVKPSGANGLVQFSSYDQALYGSQTAEFIQGDLPLEHGIGLRLFRSLVNPGATSPTPKDTSSFYTVSDATLADPVIASPTVFLPALPIDATLYPITVRVEQGTGSFTGTLPRMDVPAPPAGIGYILDFDAQSLQFAERKSGALVTLMENAGGMALPDPLILGSNYTFEAEIAPGAGIYQPLTPGQDVLLDPTPGILTFAMTAGTLLESGASGSFSGTTFTDASSGASAQAGDYLFVTSGASKGVYKIATGGPLSAGVVTDAAGVSESGLTYELRSSVEVVVDRFWQEAILVDPDTKVERIRSVGVITNGSTIVSGSGTFPDSVTMASVTNFQTAGVQVGDTLELTSGPNAGSFRLITIVDTNFVQVATPFTSYTGATFTIHRRLRVAVVDGPNTRFRFGQTVFSTTTSVVSTDSAFTSPAAGTVEISQATGNLNFSVADLTSYAGLTTYWVRRMLQGRDYRLQPALGFIDFTERFLSGEEGLVTYVPLIDGIPGAPLTERLTFLVRKEVTQPFPRPAITSGVSFNPLGKTVATTPAPAAFRGGRPQTIPTQCAVNTTFSTITFQPDTGYMSNALPHGANLAIDEQICVDYYVYEAFGGEKSVNLLNAMSVASVSIVDGSTSFVVKGDQTGVFPVGYLFRIEKDQAFQIAGSTYDGGDNETTITLGGGATFGDNVTNPRLYASSGLVRTTPVSYFPSYFRFETSPFEVVPRGMNVIRVFGDQTIYYRAGTVLIFTVGLGFELYLVSGAVLKDGRTEITLTSNTRRQYSLGTNFLKSSLRPILEDGVTTAQTARTIILTEPYGFFRKVEGLRGQLLTTPTDYKVDTSGLVTYATPLVTAEELGTFYTGNGVLQAGVRVRMSYTHSIAPSASNGLEGQVLMMDYTTFGPDTFFFRVETLTNFSAEVAAYFEAQARSSIPTGGPVTSNASTPKLYEQGQESVYFLEGHIANQDYVSQRFLKFLNDDIHHLEDALQSLDGRIVGAWQGRFRFDGIITNPPRTTYTSVTNEIDDVFQISVFPYTFSWPPLVVTYIGTYQALYQPGNQSRLYPTARSSLFGVTTAGQNTGANTGDPILDFRWKSLVDVPPVIYRRLPRGLVTLDAAVGDTTLYLDNATGTQDFYRPAFAVGMKVVITALDGSILVADGSPLTVGSVLASPERITVGPLPVPVPAGSTVFLCVSGATPDTVYAKNYRTNTDIAVNTDAGTLLYIKPYPPLDGSIPLVPVALRIHPPDSSEFLQVDPTTVLNVAKAPFRFPALDGKAMDDVEDTGLPMKIKTFDCEQSYGGLEVSGIASVLAASTVAVALPGISLDVTQTVLTSPAPWAPPLPQLYDLVRFTTGPNATAGFHRITAVGASTVTVDMSFPSATASDSIVITASVNVAVGAATFPLPTTLDDPTLSGSIQVGQTVILTSGLNLGTRRQVVSLLSATQVQLDFAVPFLASPATYRVSNHLSTYGRVSTLVPLPAEEIATTLTNDHHIIPTKVDAQVVAIDRFFDGDILGGTSGNLTDMLSPASQAGSVSGITLTGTTDFVVAGVSAAHYVYIRMGSSRGFYKVATVLSPTALQVTVAFPVVGPVTYRIVKPYNVTAEGLADLFAALVGAEDWANASMAWAALVASIQPVYVFPIGLDGSIYANSLLTSDLTTRSSLVSARQTVILNYAAGPIAQVEQTLKSRDKFYAQRFTWIDGRVNVEKGFLYMKARAITTRNENLVKQLNDLIKLLSLEAA